MLYPFESGRAHMYKKRNQWLKAPLLADIMDFYCPAIFRQLDVDVLSNDILLRKGLSKYQLFILTGNNRVQKGTVEQLDKFAKGGGVLVVNYDSLKVEDEFNKPIKTPAFLGASLGAAITKSLVVSSKTLDLKNTKTVKSEFASLFGIEVIPGTAKVIATYADGKAAVTVNNYGRGKVYYIGCELDYTATTKLMNQIIDSNNIEKSLHISSDKPAEFIETHVLGRNGRYAWYIFNWGGGDRKLNVACKNIPDGNYRIVNVVKDKVVTDNISADKIKKGISVSAKSHEPGIYLVEDKKLKPTKLQKLSSKQQKFVNMWRPSPKGDVKVLIGSRGAVMGRTRMLTAVNMLEKFGFEFGIGMNELNTEMETFNKESKFEKLSDYQIVTFMGNNLNQIKYPKKVQKALEKYVREGGSLLLAANFYVGPHGWYSNNRLKSLPRAFGVNYTNTNIRDTQEHGFVPEFPIFTDIAKNEITKGVKVFQSRGMSMLKVKNPKAKVLVKAGKNANRPRTPVMVALEYGKGRVVILGNARWMKPDYFCKGDNAQLLLNIFNWLAHHPVRVESKADLQELTDMRF
ncbi:MAG: hypothetical protein GY750_20215 [Lentisphaerae bacterium]|nr:hypothetical protein [Lentisphaerota bacterium]MCP4103719.1 hypothetical protein [Lentisphaerota bacterium]